MRAWPALGSGMGLGSGLGVTVTVTITVTVTVGYLRPGLPAGLHGRWREVLGGAWGGYGYGYGYGYGWVPSSWATCGATRAKGRSTAV